MVCVHELRRGERFEYSSTLLKFLAVPLLHGEKGFGNFWRFVGALLVVLQKGTAALGRA